MGRGRGKGKKQSVIASREEAGSGEEEKVPAFKRRGRPQKPLKDEEEEEDIEEADEDNNEEVKTPISGKDIKFPAAATENGRKRKRSTQMKENIVKPKDENGIGSKPTANDSPKSLGFRQNGSRRKSKPRRAAEAGVKCK